MSRYTFLVMGPRSRHEAMKVLAASPDGTRVEIKAVKRTPPQNARMWAMLTDVARQIQWHGVWLTPDDWKLIFLDALARELRIVPNLDSSGFVNLGRKSSDLSKQEMGDLMTLIEAWGAQQGVVFSEPERDAA